ncbi:MAG: hypothetical protein FJZ49_00210 [Candidatus Verstraetearchaeota archaeon]|nr:hypothetical protein [Candidatus Verstraetearchaeota archaeon]
MLTLLIAVPIVAATASYTASSVLGNINATVLPSVESVLAKLYKPGGEFSGQIPITHARVELTSYHGSIQTSGIYLKFQGPDGTAYWSSLASRPQPLYNYWTKPTGPDEPLNGPIHQIYTPLLLQYDGKPRPVAINIGYELFEQTYSMLKDRQIINCSMDQLKIISFWTPDHRDSAKVWVDGTSPIVVLSTSRFYSWLEFRVVEGKLDGMPVPVDGRSAVLPAGTAGSHTLVVVLQSWIPIFKTRATFQISI